jgi:polyphosphate kinase
MMREAGVDVVYGVTGLKTHAKAMLIIRSEGDRIRRYAHMGTGNYHPSTAKIYTDLSLLTCREELTTELAETFNCLTGVSRFPDMNELLVAPWGLYAGFQRLIENEIGHSWAGRPCGIYAKVNSLVEEGIIEALYRASAAGVPIRLLVRGMCAIKVGIPGVSENIEVRSIVGRFLEHSRIFHFVNGGEKRVYLGSADWMPRNLFRRVETVFPVTAPGMVVHIEEILEWFWKDNVKAQVMQPDGTYRFCRREPGELPFDAQAEFLADAQRRRKNHANRHEH